MRPLKGTSDQVQNGFGCRLGCLPRGSCSILGLRIPASKKVASGLRSDLRPVQVSEGRDRNRRALCVRRNELRSIVWPTSAMIQMLNFKLLHRHSCIFAWAAFARSHVKRRDKHLGATSGKLASFQTRAVNSRRSSLSLPRGSSILTNRCFESSAATRTSSGKTAAGLKSCANLQRNILSSAEAFACSNGPLPGSAVDALWMKCHAFIWKRFPCPFSQPIYLNGGFIKSPHVGTRKNPPR